MELYRCDLARCNQTLDAVDLDIRLTIAFNGDERKRRPEALDTVCSYQNQ